VAGPVSLPQALGLEIDLEPLDGDDGAGTEGV
jgi:hypothetical protein